MTSLIDVWRNVNERIGFFTKETKDSIPAAAGVYAWFLPLWRYPEATNVDEFIQLVCGYFLYDSAISSTHGVPKRCKNIKFNWDLLKLEVEKSPKLQVSETVREQWAQMEADPSLKKTFEKSLMEATLLTRPLYVGKTGNLRVRYQQHTDGSFGDDNKFPARFSEYVRSCNMHLDVSDLLFMCIRTEDRDSPAFRKNDFLNELLESILMRLVSPPFSMR